MASALRQICLHIHTEFRKRRGRRLEPLDPPQWLPAPAAVDAGELPSVADFEAAVAEASLARRVPDNILIHGSGLSAAMNCEQVYLHKLL